MPDEENLRHVVALVAPGPLALVPQRLLDAGLPKEVAQAVFGVPDEVSRHLLGSPVIRKLSFTGSTVVGKDRKSVV